MQNLVAINFHTNYIFETISIKQRHFNNDCVKNYRQGKGIWCEEVVFSEKKIIQVSEKYIFVVSKNVGEELMIFLFAASSSKIYEKYSCWSDIADNNENLVDSGWIWTCMLGYLERRSTYWAIEPIGIFSDFRPLTCTKYFRDDLKFVLYDAQCFNRISESSEIYEWYSYYSKMGYS